MPPPPAADPELLAIDAIRGVIGSVLGLGGGKLGELFASYGSQLLFYLTVIAVAWVGIKNVIEHQSINKIFADYLVVLLTWSIASWMIGDRGEGSLAREINNGFDMLANNVFSAAAAATTGQTLQTPAYSPNNAEYEKQTENFQSNIVIGAIGKSMLTAAKMFESQGTAKQESVDQAKSIVNKAEQEAAEAK